MAQFKQDTKTGYSHSGLLNPEIAWVTENDSVLLLDLTTMEYETRPKPDLDPSIPSFHSYFSAMEKDVCIYTYMDNRGVGIVGKSAQGESIEMEFPEPDKFLLYRIEYGNHSHEVVMLFQNLDEMSDKLFAYFPCFERQKVIFLGALNHVDRTVEVRLAQGRVVFPCKDGIKVVEAVYDTEKPWKTEICVLPHQGRMCFAFGKYVLVYGCPLTTPDMLPVEIFDFDCCYWLIDVSGRRVLKSREGAKFFMNALGASGPVILEGNSLFLGLITNSERRFTANLHSHIQLIQRIITEEQIKLWFGELER